MVYVLLIFLIIIIIQNFYIRYLKKEICLRDGTYQPKKRKRLFRKRKDEKGVRHYVSVKSIDV